VAESIDDALFQRIMYTTLTMLFTTSFLQGASLCIILHKDIMIRQLTIIVSAQLCNRNFIHRMLFKDCYCLYHIRRLRNVIQ